MEAVEAFGPPQGNPTPFGRQGSTNTPCRAQGRQSLGLWKLRGEGGAWGWPPRGDVEAAAAIAELKLA